MLVAVGTYTEKEDRLTGKLGEGVYTFWVDEEGRLKPTGHPPLKCQNPTYLIRHPRHRVLYAVHETMSWPGIDGEASAVSSMRYDANTGELEVLNVRPFKGAVACHLDTDGTHLCVACYVGREGQGIVHVLALDEASGALGEVVDTAATNVASGAAGDAAREGVDSGRQDSPHPHMAHMLPAAATSWRDAPPEAASVALVPDLGGDCIYALAIDAGSGSFMAVGPGEGLTGDLESRARVTKLTTGCGPRHCAVDVDRGVAYIVTELMSTVEVLSLKTMKVVQSVKTLQGKVDLSGNPFFAERIKQSECAAVKLSADGKFLYASNRGHDSITVFAITEEEGRGTQLVEKGCIPSGGRTPRDFFVGPNGQYVLALNQDALTGQAVRFTIKDGLLIPTGDSYEIPSPVTMVILPS